MLGEYTDALTLAAEIPFIMLAFMYLLRDRLGLYYESLISRHQLSRDKLGDDIKSGKDSLQSTISHIWRKFLLNLIAKANLLLVLFFLILSSFASFLLAYASNNSDIAVSAEAFTSWLDKTHWLYLFIIASPLAFLAVYSLLRLKVGPLPPGSNSQGDFQ